MAPIIGSDDLLSAMIGENLKLEKALITKTNLQQNQVDRDCQLWQVVESFESVKVGADSNAYHRFSYSCDILNVSVVS